MQIGVAKVGEFGLTITEKVVQEIPATTSVDVGSPETLSVVSFQFLRGGGGGGGGLLF
jgi:hypothetical protein